MTLSAASSGSAGIPGTTDRRTRRTSVRRVFAFHEVEKDARRSQLPQLHVASTDGRDRAGVGR